MAAQEARRPGALAQPEFLPTTRAEMDALGWDALDVLLVSGDAYVDHPSFGAALLGRWLVANGYRTGICAQPRWTSSADVERMGRPSLFAGVTAGSLDSMLAHYTAFRKKRSDDAYTPGGLAGARPNRATIVYAGLVRQAFAGLPVVIGGIEASLRRASQYDFWSDAMRRSILLDSKADLLLYGMAERSILEVARRLGALPVGLTGARECLRGVCGSAFAGGAADVPGGTTVVELPSHEDIVADPKLLMDATLAIESQVHRADVWLVQRAGGRSVVIAPPCAPETPGELDAVYALPFSRAAHGSYREAIPAEEMIRASVTTHRGCAGGCAFCALAIHQGRRIRSRGAASILDEVTRMSRQPAWRGSVSDLGGPSANMWGARCTADPARCARRSCLTPAICPSFDAPQARIVELLRAVAATDGVRHVRVASGVRHDLAMADREYLRALVAEFTGGQLKVAPEHVVDGVLALMRKPGRAAFERFLAAFEDESRRAGKKQYVVPYLMSAFPGCTDADMVELAVWLRARGWHPQQVQCFIPLPGTVAAAMYCAGIDAAGRPIPVARSDRDRLRQHWTLLSEPGSSHTSSRGRDEGPEGGWEGGAKGSGDATGGARPAPGERSGGAEFHRARKRRGR